MFGLALLALCVGVCVQQARAKDRNPTTWAVLGFLFGVFAVAAVLLLPAQGYRKTVPTDPRMLADLTTRVDNHQLWQQLCRQVGPASARAAWDATARTRTEHR